MTHFDICVCQYPCHYPMININDFDIVFFLRSFYVGHRIHDLDKRIKEIRGPKLIRRNFRPLAEREYYHAYEWKFILLFIARPILKGILPER